MGKDLLTIELVFEYLLNQDTLFLWFEFTVNSFVGVNAI